MLNQSHILTFSGRLYTLLLLAYPTRFRRAYGREMAQVFRDDIRCTFQESGAAGLIGLWFLVGLDLLETAFAEHIWEVFHMPIEKPERWTGLAAALGGALWVFLILSISLWNEVWNEVNEVVIIFLLVAIMLLWAIALGGLYRRLPAAAHPANKVTFAIAEIGLMLLAIGLLLLHFTELAEIATAMGILALIGMVLGIAGMGVVALLHRVLGFWRFAPLTLGGVFLAFIVVTTIPESPQQLQNALIILIGISWLLLGIGLWSSAREETGPALSA